MNYASEWFARLLREPLSKVNYTTSRIEFGLTTKQLFEFSSKLNESLQRLTEIQSHYLFSCFSFFGFFFPFFFLWKSSSISCGNSFRNFYNVELIPSFNRKDDIGRIVFSNFLLKLNKVVEIRETIINSSYDDALSQIIRI